MPNRTIRRVLHVSGGKDSTAMLLLAIELRDRYGMDFECVFADTGNEHELTLEYIADLPRLTGGPAITWVKADFSHQIARRREFVAHSDKYTDEMRERILPALRPSGNPFLDLCLWKGASPALNGAFVRLN